MHIMITDNYLSLDNIVTVENLTHSTIGDPHDCFMIRYHGGQVVSFYHRKQAQFNGEFHVSAFYFQEMDALINVRNEIIKILTGNAIKSI